MRNTQPSPSRRVPHSKLAQIVALGALCVVASFTVGLHTAGDIQPIALIEAGTVASSGDLDGSGSLDIEDAIFILEVVEGYRTVEPGQLVADPSGDGILTIDDALHILSILSLQN